MGFKFTKITGLNDKGENYSCYVRIDAIQDMSCKAEPPTKLEELLANPQVIMDLITTERNWR